MSNILAPTGPALPGLTSRYGGTQATEGTRALLAGAAGLAAGEGAARTARVIARAGRSS